MPELNENYVRSTFTLKDFIRTCIMGEFGNRWGKKYKDAYKTIAVRFDRVSQVKLKYPANTEVGEMVNNFRATVFTKDEKGGRSKPVVILLSELSLDASIKVRCGSTSSYRSGDNLGRKGICGDFYFLFMHVLASNRILYGKNSTTGVFPSTTNPNNVVGTCKHIANAIRKLVESGFFGLIDNAHLLASMRKEAKKIGK